jgi:hypothetical protein
LHSLFFFLLHGQFEELFRHAADIICSFQNRLATLAATELQVEESSRLACFEDTILLCGILREKLDQGNSFEIDGFELGRGWEWRVLVWRELCGVRHCGKCSVGRMPMLSVFAGRTGARMSKICPSLSKGNETVSILITG